MGLQTGVSMKLTYLLLLDTFGFLFGLIRISFYSDVVRLKFWLSSSSYITFISGYVMLPSLFSDVTVPTSSFFSYYSTFSVLSAFSLLLLLLKSWSICKLCFFFGVFNSSMIWSSYKTAVWWLLSATYLEYSFLLWVPPLLSPSFMMIFWVLALLFRLAIEILFGTVSVPAR